VPHQRVKTFLIVGKLTPDGLTPVYGLEDTNHFGHALSTFLIAKKQIVKTVNSNYTYSERKNQPIISKTDDIDSFCIAKVTLDKLDTLPPTRSDELFWTLKQLVKMRTSITDTNIEYKNKLHAQLFHHYPNYTEFFHYFDCKTALTMWETYPSPDILLQQTTAKAFADLLYKISNNAIRREKGHAIYNMVQQYDTEQMDFQPERNYLIKSLVRHIKYNNNQLSILDEEISAIMERIGYKLDTFIGLDKVSAAQIVSEVGNINRFHSADSLAKYAGIAPVEFSSGGKATTKHNKYDNRQLNSYIYMLACRHLSCGRNKDNPVSPIFLEYYNKKVSEGKTKKQAINYIMRRIIRILYGMMKTGMEYQHPEKLSDECIERFRKELAENEPP